MDAPLEVELTTLADIRDKIPADRLDAFLVDLKLWVLMDGKEIIDAYGKLLGSVFESMGVKAQIQKQINTMTWIDDGQTGLSQIATTCEGKTLSTIKLHKRPTTKDGESE